MSGTRSDILRKRSFSFWILIHRSDKRVCSHKCSLIQWVSKIQIRSIHTDERDQGGTRLRINTRGLIFRLGIIDFCSVCWVGGRWKVDLHGVQALPFTQTQVAIFAENGSSPTSQFASAAERSFAKIRKIVAFVPRDGCLNFIYGYNRRSSSWRFV